MKNTTTLTSTDRKHTIRYEVSTETLEGLSFNQDSQAPLVEVLERHSGITEKPFKAFYEATDTAPDEDEVASGVTWHLVGEANGRKVWLTLAYNNPPEGE